MHKYVHLSLLLLFSLVLSACGNSGETPPSSLAAESSVVTIPTSTTPTTAAASVPATAPDQTPFHISGLSPEDLIGYFNEVCLDAEFTNSGDPSLLQKWDTPICYRIQGNPTQEDLTVLENFTAWLNTIEGFPGILETDSSAEANLNFHFCTQQEMIFQLGDNFHGMDGGVTFWYNGDNQIYSAIICVRSDLPQQLRNSVILEELYNGLGPIQDTWLRPDSIIYADYSEPQDLTEIDRLILRLLYHPDLQCGMDAAACAEVLTYLYQ